jgi:hypothetical protein
MLLNIITIVSVLVVVIVGYALILRPILHRIAQFQKFYARLTASGASSGRTARQVRHDRLELRPRRDGFTVETGENLTGDAMRRAFNNLYATIKPGDVVLLFFSGYGIQSNRQSYLIPVDAQLWQESDIRRDGFSLEAVLSEINSRGAGVKIALLDASRRNPYERRFRSFSARHPYRRRRRCKGWLRKGRIRPGRGAGRSTG